MGVVGVVVVVVVVGSGVDKYRGRIGTMSGVHDDCEYKDSTTKVTSWIKQKQQGREHDKVKGEIKQWRQT